MPVTSPCSSAPTTLRLTISARLLYYFDESINCTMITKTEFDCFELGGVGGLSTKKFKKISLKNIFICTKHVHASLLVFFSLFNLLRSKSNSSYSSFIFFFLSFSTPRKTNISNNCLQKPQKKLKCKSAKILCIPHLLPF